MGIISNKAVSFTDVIEFLSSTGSSVPSSLGGQLDKMRDGVFFVSNSGVNNEEYKLLAKAHILDCVDKLRSKKKINFEAVEDLSNFAKKLKLGEGPLALAVTGIYHVWATRSQQRGLVEVYRFMRSLDPSLPEPNHLDEELLVNAFRTGKEKKTRDKAARLLADSELAVYSWIQYYNIKNKSKENVE